MDSRIRILHVVLNLHRGGLERIVGELVKSVDASGFDQHVLALQFLGDLAADLGDAAQLHVWQKPTRASMLYPRTLADQIRAIQPDIVHVHSGAWFKGSLAARMAGVRAVIYTDHGRQSPDPLVNRILDNLASRRTDRVVAVSSQLSDHLKRRVVSRGSEVSVIQNGVDTVRFAPEPARSGAAQFSRKFVIGSVGRLDRVKGFDVMLDAFDSFYAQRRGLDVDLVIVGDGPERNTLVKRIEQSPHRERIHLTGWAGDIETVLRTFDLFTMTSWSEGTSMSLLEAMSTGVCPVVTDVGGNAHVLGSGLSHRLVKPGNTQEIAAAWLRAVDDPGRLQDDRRMARERAVGHFSVKAMAVAYETLYRSVLSA
jgi:glycosyltransferase involved in cell wall biosynthesis